MKRNRSRTRLSPWPVALAGCLGLLTLQQIWQERREQHELQAEARIVHLLGATTAPLDAATSAEIGTSREERGVVVTSLSRGGRGRLAGLAPNDIIEAIGLINVSTPQQLARELRSSARGPIAMRINRHGNIKTVIVPAGPATRPPDYPSVSSYSRAS